MLCTVTVCTQHFLQRCWCRCIASHHSHLPYNFFCSSKNHVIKRKNLCKYCSLVHTEVNKRFSVFEISPSQLTHVCFLCRNAVNFHQEVYTGLTILNVILIFGWVGEEIARKTSPRLQMMYTPRRSTQPLRRRSLLSKYPTGIRYALTCNSIKKSEACFKKIRSCLKALDRDLLCQI
jgi:hypothetical protein